MNKPVLDSMDRKLLQILMHDARASATSIAKSLSVARSTVHQRIAKLEDEGIILGYSAIVSATPDNQRVQALLYVKVKHQDQGIVSETLQQFPEILCCLSNSGAGELICWSAFPELEDIDPLLDDISRIHQVEDIRTTILTANKFHRSFQPFSPARLTSLCETGSPRVSA